MASVLQGVSLLARTEKDLRKLLAQAANAGAYEDVVQLAAWARSLHEMVNRVSNRSSDDEAVNGKQANSRNAGKAFKPMQSKRLPTGDTYPRFYRQGDTLLRVSWSKRENSEYEQRAPRQALDAVIAALEQKGADGRVLSAEQILSLLKADGFEFPSYQVYAVIALLKQVGLVDQHGRRGYSLAHPGDLRVAVDGIWRSLTEK